MFTLADSGLSPCGDNASLCETSAGGYCRSKSLGPSRLCIQTRCGLLFFFLFFFGASEVKSPPPDSSLGILMPCLHEATCRQWARHLPQYLNSRVTIFGSLKLQDFKGEIMSQGEIIRCAAPRRRRLLARKVLRSPVTPWQHGLLVEVDRGKANKERRCMCPQCTASLRQAN